MNVLGIETSCDETAAAVVRDGRKVLSSAVASQLAVHRPFRGVVPELASRAHVERINEIIAEALRKKNHAPQAIAVTTGPGLIGCLLVGVVTARTIGWVRKLPIVGVNHLEGHLFAGLVEHPKLKPPFLGLIVSGGHTELVVFKGYGRYERLGATRDDAAGEAFDKVANLLNLPFPGGPSIDRMAAKGNPKAVAFPRAWIPGTHDFSFSGIKTSVANYLKTHHGKKRARVADLCASFQEAVVDVLVQKTIAAAKSRGLRSIVIGGGVAANRRLRRAFEDAADGERLSVYLPDRVFCTDNAAMIAAAGYYKLKHGLSKPDRELTVDANSPIRNWTAS
jgi:N6-L-threonylcarbamoyladenine synthase